MEQKADVELLKRIDAKLNSDETVTLTKEETTAIRQEIKRITNEMKKWGEIAELGSKMINESKQAIFKLASEIGISGEFIHSKGLRKEYQNFKSKKLKTAKRNQPKTKLFK